jgi:hypothetical protein
LIAAPIANAPDMSDEPNTGDHRPPVVVARHSDRGEAEVTRARLAAAGLDAQVVDDVEGGTVPVDGEAGVAVAVPADQGATARALLDDTR